MLVLSGSKGAFYHGFQNVITLNHYIAIAGTILNA